MLRPASVQPEEPRPGAAAAPAPAEPPFEKLVEFNARELFGVVPEFKDGRVVLRFPGKGSFAQAFRSNTSGLKGFIANLDDIKDPNLKGSLFGGVEGSFSVAAIDSGEAVSKFELSEEVKVSFRAKCAAVPPGATFVIRLNQADSRNFIQTSFLQDVVVMDAGKQKRKATSDPTFAASPTKWFIQKNVDNNVTPIELVYHEKKLDVGVTVYPGEKNKGERKSTVVFEGIESPSGGRIVLRFAKMSLGISDLVIEGKYSKPWAEAEIARLRKEKKLRLQAEDPAEVAAREEEAKKGKKRPTKPGPRKTKDDEAGANAKKDEGSARAPRPKKQPPNVDQPDPEADADL